MVKSLFWCLLNMVPVKQRSLISFLFQNNARPLDLQEKILSAIRHDPQGQLDSVLDKYISAGRNLNIALKGISSSSETMLEKMLKVSFQPSSLTPTLY